MTECNPTFIEHINYIVRKEQEEKYPNKSVYFKQCGADDPLQQILNDINKHIMFYMESFKESLQKHRI